MKALRKFSMLCAFTLIPALLFLFVSSLPVRGVAGKARRWAVIVGINSYQKDVTPLRCAVNDAQEFKRALVESAGFDEDDIFLLTSDQTKGTRMPDRVNIVRWVTYVSQNAKPEDTFIFFFSGHGMDMDRESYLLTVEAEPMSAATLEMSSLKVKDLMKYVDQMSAGKKLLFIDACRNDPRTGKGDSNNSMTDNFSKNLRIRGPESRSDGGMLSATFYSCAVGERSYEWSQKSMGFFTYYLVRGIEGEARSDDGKVTVDSLKRYISEKVKSAVDREQGAVQRPWVSMSGEAGEGSFALSAGNAPTKPRQKEGSVSQGDGSPSERPTPSSSPSHAERPTPAASGQTSYSTPVSQPSRSPSVSVQNIDLSQLQSYYRVNQGGGNSAASSQINQSQLQSLLSTADLPLMQAIQKGDRYTVDLLTNNGRDINKRLMSGQTALHYAVFIGRRDMVEYLLEKGADVNAKDSHGYTPLTSAKVTNRSDLVELLRKKGGHE